MVKHICILAIISIVLDTNINAQVAPHQINPAEFNWPDEYAPEKSKFFVHNEIEINASSSIVWEWIIDALAWESWYNGAEDVSFVNPADTLLLAHSVFNWKTMGMEFQSAIKAYEPNTLLAWESKKKSIKAYTVWHIVPFDAGCKVIVEESQNGWLTFLEKIFERKAIGEHHDMWLSALKHKSEDEQK